MFLMCNGFAACNSFEESTAIVADDPHIVVINKTDYSVYGNDNNVIGIFYYEQPHISDSDTVAQKINDYFIQDCYNFFEGKSLFFGEDAFTRMITFLDTGVNQWGEESLVTNPYCYFVATEVTFLSDDYISFCQTYVWAADGPRDTWNQGTTFSMKTGDIVSFTEIVDVDANTLKANICEMLIPMFDYFPERQSDIVEVFGANEHNSFEIEFDGTVVALDKNFYYNGSFIEITLNYSFLPHSGLVIQWNGSVDEQFHGKVYSNTLDLSGELQQFIHVEE